MNTPVKQPFRERPLILNNPCPFCKRSMECVNCWLERISEYQMDAAIEEKYSRKQARTLAQ